MPASPCLLVVAVLLAPMGCGVDVHEPAPDCIPLYEPTWSNVHAHTLAKSCAVSGSCHSAPGAAGLVLTDPTVAHESLLNGLITPGSVDESELMYRLSPEAGSALMPPGSLLSEPERCAISLWIREGANP